MSGNVISVDEVRLILNATVKGAAQLNQVDEALKKIDKSAKSATKETNDLKNAMLGFGLTALFSGMAIKMTAQRILTSLTTAFTAARDEGDFFNQKLLELQASFEFLKFAIFDTFAQSDIFVPLIDKMVSLINFVSMFIAKHPAIANFIVLFSGFAIAVGGVLMVIGQLALGLVGIIDLIAILKGSAIISFFAKLGAIILNGVVFAFGSLTKILVLLSKGIVFVARSFLVIFANPIGIAILAIVGGLFLLSQKLGGLKNAFKAVGIFILRVLTFIYDGIVNTLIYGMNKVIELINMIIIASNKVLKTDFSTIQTIEFRSQTGAVVDAMRDKLLSEGQEKSQTSIVNNISIDNTGGDDQKLVDMVERVLKQESNYELGSVSRG